MQAASTPGAQEAADTCSRATSACRGRAAGRACAQSSSTRAGKLRNRRRTTVAVDCLSTRFCCPSGTL